MGSSEKNGLTALRCQGHCCRRFALEHSYEELQAGVDIPDSAKIAAMVIPIKASDEHGEYVYTCKHLRSNGDCGIYETRPQMCRDFPGPEGCHFRKCESSVSAYYGMSKLKRVWTRLKWLRSL